MNFVPGALESFQEVTTACLFARHQNRLVKLQRYDDWNPDAARSMPSLETVPFRKDVESNQDHPAPEKVHLSEMQIRLPQARLGIMVVSTHLRRQKTKFKMT